MTLYKDCARCRHLMKDENCRGTASWWPLREIWLCRNQVMFLLENLNAFPPDPHISGYTEAPLTSTRIGAHAPFEAELQLWAELNYRLEQTGVAGKWLVSDAQRGVSIGELSGEPRQALHYISGWQRKKTSFRQWKYWLENRKKLDILSLK